LSWKSPSPVHCKVSSWSGFGACSKTCGSGVQARSRTVTRPARHGGTSCPSLTASQTCNTHECPVDCKADNAVAHFRRGIFTAMTGGTRPLENNGTHARMVQLESNALVGATSTRTCNKDGKASCNNGEYCAQNGCLSCGSFGCDCTCKVLRDGENGWHLCPSTPCPKSGCGTKLINRHCKIDWDCCPVNRGLSWTCGADGKCAVPSLPCHVLLKLAKQIAGAIAGKGCKSLDLQCVPEEAGIAAMCQAAGAGPEDPLSWACTFAAEGAVTWACNKVCTFEVSEAIDPILEHMSSHCHLDSSGHLIVP